MNRWLGLLLTWTLMTAAPLGCVEGDDDGSDDDASDDDGGDDDGGDDDTGDDDSGDDDTGDDDTVVDHPGPVRVLFVVDTGAFWQCSDAGGQRFAVIEQRVQDLLALPHVAVGYVMFGAEVAVQPFTTTAVDLADVIATDTPGIDPAELPYTRYVVVLLTDSVPEPTCTAGCEDDATACSDGLDNDQDGLIDGADPSCGSLELYGVCNYTGAIPPDHYVDLSGVCPSYNQETTLLLHVTALLGYELNPGVGDVALHTRPVTDPIPDVEAACGLTGHEQIHLEASGLLSILAKAGGGTSSVSGPSSPFLDGIDYAAMSMP
jgi:hypothetical protein